MSDDKTKTGLADRSRINVHEDYEVQYWSKEFGVTPERLRGAVVNAGPMVDDVRRYLHEA